MISFKSFYIAEAEGEVKEKLQHLEHIDDLIIHQQKNGALRTMQFLSRIANAMEGKTDEQLITTNKIDGAPAIVTGLIPSGEQNAGQFFIGTKSALRPNGKRYTKYNISQVGSENGPGLAEKLQQGYQYLSQLPFDGVYQGDFLFSSGDKKQATIEGKPYIIFKPNVITYAVKKDSTVGQEVAAAKIGIVFHTMYNGNTFADLHATYNPDLSKFHGNADVWIKSNRLEPSKEMVSPQDAQIVKEKVLRAQQILSTIEPHTFDLLARDNKLREFIKMHINSKVRQGQLVDNVEQHLDDLSAFIGTRYELEQQKYKTAAKQQQVAAKAAMYHELIPQIRNELIKVFSFFNLVNSAKAAILKNLKSVGGLESFYDEGGQYRKTSGEGIVLADGKTNDVVKIVDRLDFSRINFNAAKEWK